MSRTWKWILGVLAVLVVVALAVGSIFMWRNHIAWWGPRGMMYSSPTAPGSQQPPTGPYGFNQYPRSHMDDWAWGMPMMHGGGFARPYGFTPFGTGYMILFGLIRLALPLGVLALVAYVFYQMGKRAAVSSAARPPAATKPDVKPLPARKVAGR